MAFISDSYRQGLLDVLCSPESEEHQSEIVIALKSDYSILWISLYALFC